MQGEKLIEKAQVVVFLFAVSGYGYSLYRFLSFYIENNELTWIAIAVSAFLFVLPWGLIGVLLAFAVKVVIISLTGILSTTQTLLRH